jgi:patatin-like phospholipase/acyl hydrolase
VRRILSIDGGGIKGVFPAAFLANVEQALGRSVAEYFDLIVGTSTGGIIALGLGLGVSAEAILDLYRKNAGNIFPRNTWFRKLRQLFTAGYDPKPLKAALREVFGDRRLGESKRRLVIPSFNLETGEVYNWKTSHHPRLERDYRAKVVDVGLSTAAAPTYFPTYRTSGCVPLIDGGVWANNPIAVAAVEAVGVLGWPREQLRILSLGCTSCPIDTRLARFRSLGQSYWVTRLADLFLTAQNTSALGMAQHLVTNRDFVKRISPTIGVSIKLDDVSEIPSLVGLADSESRKELPSLRLFFFQEPFAEVFKPCHSL